MQRISDWISLLEYNRNFHIRIFCTPETARRLGLDTCHRFHNDGNCSYIKNQPGGMARCMRCRTQCDIRAATQGAFADYCVHGLFQVVCPVSEKNEWAATVYITHIDPSDDRTALQAACDRYSLSYPTLTAGLRDAERTFSTEALYRLAAAVAELCQNRLAVTPAPVGVPLPDAVRRMLLAADDPAQSTTLSSLALALHKNEKYLGRLFRQHIGQSFCAYRNERRLQTAAQMLREGRQKIIDIAFAVGFNEVTYFNRLFHRRFGKTPAAYRAEFQKRP